MTGRLTTHVLDLSRGVPASGVKVQLWRMEAGGSFVLLAVTDTNADGRLDRPLLDNGLLEPGMYELVFFAGDYFGGKLGASVVSGEAAAEGEGFLEQVPVRFRVSDPNAHYHVPLLVAPGGYSTYRGS